MGGRLEKELWSAEGVGETPWLMQSLREAGDKRGICHKEDGPFQGGKSRG